MKKDPVAVAFGNIQRAARKSLNVSQNDVAHAVGGKCTASSISRYENGDELPSLGRYLEICHVLDIDEREAARKLLKAKGW